MFLKKKAHNLFSKAMPLTPSRNNSVKSADKKADTPKPLEGKRVRMTKKVNLPLDKPINPEELKNFMEKGKFGKNHEPKESVNNEETVTE